MFRMLALLLFVSSATAQAQVDLSYYENALRRVGR